jgi:hypothetical protein
MVKADWKSAEQIKEDFRAGHVPDQRQLLIDLWQRVDELQAKIADIERRQERAPMTS